jgi:hypothetical protein
LGALDFESFFVFARNYGKKNATTAREKVT